MVLCDAFLAFVQLSGETSPFHSLTPFPVAIALGVSHYETMLLPGWVLFTTCAAIGVTGLVIARKKPWAAAISFIAILCIVGTTIVQLRDPLSLMPQDRHATQSWGYIAMLFWSCLVGLTLPVLGLYLRSRHRKTDATRG